MKKRRRRKREEKKEKKKKKIKVWNRTMEYEYGLYVYNLCMENMCLELWYRIVWFGCGPQWRKILYRENVGFNKICCQNFSKTHVFVLVITWSSFIQIE